MSGTPSTSPSKLTSWLKTLKGTPSESGEVSSSPAAVPPTSPAATGERPGMGYKSHSSHTFKPLSSYFGSSPTTTPDIRKQRDEFIMQQQLNSMGNSAVFGVPLEDSVNVAEGKIYISTDDDGLVVYGRIPRVVASCGLYLKQNALDTEGIFRVAGSNKRIKQLQLIFSTPPDYGTKIDWDGYTVHDASSLLRRYLGALPEPLIPYSLYEDFREPLRSRPAILKYFKDRERKMSQVGDSAPPAVSNASINASVATPTNESVSTVVNHASSPANDAPSSTTDANSASETEGDVTTQTEEDKKQRKKQRKQELIKERREALQEYAQLFDKLPDLQRQLLFYILDLLAIFNMHSDKNRMPAKNLASVFQPSILSHSDHDMALDEYALSSLVIEFMITYSHKILPAAQESARLAAIQDQQRQVEKKKKQQLSPPAKTTRAHSKSLSSVQNPQDSLRVSSRGNLAKLDSNSSEEFSDMEKEDNYMLPKPPPVHIEAANSPKLSPPGSDGSPTSTTPQSPTHSFIHILANKLSPRLRSQTVGTSDVPTEKL